MVFRPMRSRAIGFIGIFVFLGVLGGLLWWKGRFLIASLSLVMSAIGIPLSLLSMLPNAAYLKITREGFETCSLFRRRGYLWKDIAGFSVYREPQHGFESIVWNYTDEYWTAKGRKTRDKLEKIATGYDAALSDNCGVPVVDLMRMLEYAHAAATGRIVVEKA